MKLKEEMLASYIETSRLSLYTLIRLVNLSFSEAFFKATSLEEISRFPIETRLKPTNQAAVVYSAPTCIGRCLNIQLVAGRVRPVKSNKRESVGWWSGRRLAVDPHPVHTGLLPLPHLADQTRTLSPFVETDSAGRRRRRRVAGKFADLLEDHLPWRWRGKAF